MSDIAFLVNGSDGSAAGERAQRIADRLEPGSAAIAYREGGRGGATSQMISLLRRQRPRLVYAMDLALAPVAAWATTRRHTPLIVDTGDTPRHFMDLIGASRARRIAASALERIGYGRSERIVVRGAHHATQLRNDGYDHVEVIPDGVDLAFFRPLEVWSLREQLGLADDLTVGIQGNFTWYPQLGGGLGWELVEAMALRPDLPLRAVLIGSGPGLEHLRLLAEERGVAERVHIMGRVRYDQLPRYLSLCDVTLLTQTNDPSSWARTTGKLPGYLASGRHIIASRVGTAADLLPEPMLLDYHGGWDLTYPGRLAARLAEVCEDIPGARARGLELCPLAGDYDYDLVADLCVEQIRSVAA